MKTLLTWCCATVMLLGVNRTNADPLVNGDFEAHETEVVGWTVEGVVQVITLPEDMNRVALIQENPKGAFSRFYQVFDLPEDPVCLSFKFLMVSNPFTCPNNSAEGEVATGQAPPDAFLVFLTTPDTLERLVVPPDCEPTFTEAFFWMDNDNQTSPQFCDELGLVGATDITSADFSTVSLDLSSLAGNQSVRLEFGIVDGCDGQNTQVIVDDVIIETVGDGAPTNCAALNSAVPAVSSWGLLITGLFLAVAGSRAFRRC